MKNYNALITISKVLNVLGYINLIAGLLFAVLFFQFIPEGNSGSYIGLLWGVLIVIFTLLICLLLWGASQFIGLMVDVAGNIANIDYNLYVTLKEKQDNEAKMQENR